MPRRIFISKDAGVAYAEGQLADDIGFTVNGKPMKSYNASNTDEKTWKKVKDKKIKKNEVKKLEKELAK